MQSFLRDGRIQQQSNTDPVEEGWRDFTIDWNKDDALNRSMRMIEQNAMPA